MFHLKKKSILAAVILAFVSREANAFSPVASIAVENVEKR